MRILKAISKQLLGEHYQCILESFFICTILFFSLRTAEIKLKISPHILFLMATLFSSSVMWQALRSNRNSEILMGIFMLPFNNKELASSYVTAFCGYTMITKTSVVLSLFFAICEWTIPQLIAALLCACNGCLMTAVWYLMIRKQKILSAVLWAFCIVLTILFVHRLPFFLSVIGISLFLAIFYILSADAYTFYQTKKTKANLKHHFKRGSILVYLLRYLLTNKNYFINTVILWIIACFLPFLFGQHEGINAMPLGFALLSLNTPIGILLSCDSSLVQTIRILPRQTIQFYSRYCIFISIVNAAVNSFYLCSWQLQYGNVNGLNILTALLFAIQSAILSVFLEWLHPIRSWKIESDLWHHPRKYIVPLLMMILALTVSIWTPAIWLLLCIILSEGIAILIKGRKI